MQGPNDSATTKKARAARFAREQRTIDADKKKGATKPAHRRVSHHTAAAVHMSTHVHRRSGLLGHCTRARPIHRSSEPWRAGWGLCEGRGLLCCVARVAV